MEKDLVKEEFTEMIPFSKYWNEQNPSGNQFGAAHILKEEIMEEDSMFNERLQTNVTERFPEHPSRLEVMRKNSIEDPKESKFSPTDSVENTDFNGLIDQIYLVNFRKTPKYVHNIV
ncbi:hypothetical protein JTB14_014413 [Gonioctena quinquepunctata]|nr:hypothetical protein JTB14_014413 [Gonioctena quinquepunctata]